MLNIQVKVFPALCTVAGTVFSCTNYFRVIFTGGVGKNGSTIAVSVFPVIVYARTWSYGHSVFHLNCLKPLVNLEFLLCLKKNNNIQNFSFIYTCIHLYAYRCIFLWCTHIAIHTPLYTYIFLKSMTCFVLGS